MVHLTLLQKELNRVLYGVDEALFGYTGLDMPFCSLWSLGPEPPHASSFQVFRSHRKVTEWSFVSYGCLSQLRPALDQLKQSPRITDLSLANAPGNVSFPVDRYVVSIQANLAFTCLCSRKQPRLKPSSSPTALMRPWSDLMSLSHDISVPYNSGMTDCSLNSDYSTYVSIMRWLRVGFWQ